MDKRIQKSIETKALQDLAETARQNTVLLEEIARRLDRLEASQSATPKAPSNLTVKGGR